MAICTEGYKRQKCPDCKLDYFLSLSRDN